MAVPAEAALPRQGRHAISGGQVAVSCRARPRMLVLLLLVDVCKQAVDRICSRC
jgi:hypothetical protein